MNKIWKWVKWVGAAIVGIGILILVYYEMSGKGKQKAQIDEKIKELNAIESHTEAQKLELAELKKQAEAVQADIDAATKRAAEALAALKGNKEEPGDAGKAADDLTSVWK